MSTQVERGQNGLVVERRLSQEGQDPLDAVQWGTVEAQVFRGEEKTTMMVEAPPTWSQNAVNIAASKYLKGSHLINEGRGETSIRALIERVVDTIADQGVAQGHFSNQATRDIFRDELAQMMVEQRAAFNSPVYFNCGLKEKYDLGGTSAGNFHWDAKSGQPVETADYFTNPALSACFIASIKDDLKDIWEHVGREMKIFKGGAGVGVNFSSLRSVGETLSTGGTSSGVLSFLEVFDRAAGSTKSGGTSRRAAKMVILNADHPEVFQFVRWKAREEQKAQMLIAAGLSSDFNGEAYKTVAGQNSNNSVRVTDEFMQAVMEDGDWDLKAIRTGEVVRTIKARELFKEICDCAWECADPGLQFDTTINAWNTCAKSGRIDASNPCGEFLGINDSACNLSSINLVKFLNEDGTFDVATFRHVCRILTIAMDIIVDYASYPIDSICRNSHIFRPVGLGFSNLGCLLMRMGIPYDSDAGRAIASTISAMMTAAAYAMSSEMAEVIGPFQAFKQNRTSMLAVISKHARKAANPAYEKMCPEYLMDTAAEMWDEVVALGKKSGFRNSQVSLIAPTGTISFLMDCDTTGIEPEFALVKVKKYAGGGTAKIVNQSVEVALEKLGYSAQQIADILKYAVGHGSLKKQGEGVSEMRLHNLGFPEDVIAKINSKIPDCWTCSDAIRAVPEAMEIVRTVAKRFGTGDADAMDPLTAIGVNEMDIEAANTYCCGHMNVENAPHLKPEHLPIFDCANPCGKDGVRYICPEGHLKMVAAVQPFLSGAISKTTNLPNSATSQDIWDIYVSAWQQGLKGVTVYRDGSKGSQPLSTDRSGAGADSSEKGGAWRNSPPPLMMTGMRRRLTLNGYVIYVHAYRDDDGRINEIWIDTKPGGGLLEGLLNSIARMTSTMLQHGIPIESLVEKFAYTAFDPAGPAGHPEIPFCRSVIDLIFRTIAVDFIGDKSYSNAWAADPEIKQEEGIAITHSRNKEVIICSNCGSDLVVKTGTCTACNACGTTSGCS